jgi:hypothetical protein
MKKIIFALFICTNSLCYGQKEIKLDIADALVIRALEFSYENYISENSSFGISALFNLAKQNVSFRYNENTMVTPYYRHYFTTSEKWNIFGEAFVGINSGKKESVKDSDDYDLKYTDGALGVAIGTKYVATGGLIIDAYAGLGRNLFGVDSPVVIPRVGVNVGWRF